MNGREGEEMYFTEAICCGHAFEGEHRCSAGVHTGWSRHKHKHTSKHEDELEEATLATGWTA